MKKVIAVVAALAWTIAPANADVYVKVDANGNAIGGAIACGADVCGDPNSVYSQMTLGAGERYVLQGLGDTGIGNNNSDTQVKVDVATQTWTVTSPTKTEIFTPYDPPKVEETPVFDVPVFETSTAITDTATVVTDTATATSSSTTFEQLYAQVMALLTQILALIAKLNG